MGELIDLTGKRAVVTGGSRGLGRAVAVLLARAGASVGIGYRSRQEAAREVLEEMRALGSRGWAEPGDLSTASDARRLFERADAEFGGLDIFVGNHGIWPHQDVALADMDEAQWRTTLGANLDAIFFTCREAARRLGEGGRIVLIGSTAGQRGEAWHADYAASKGAIISLVKSFCIELADRGITVNCVAPGWFWSDMVEPVLLGDALERVTRSIPLGRVASAEDIAGPVVFLCSSLARHITGEVLNVNGGAVLVG